MNDLSKKYTDMTYDFGINLEGLRNLESKMYGNLSNISWAIGVFEEIINGDINWVWRKKYDRK